MNELQTIPKTTDRTIVHPPFGRQYLTYSAEQAFLACPRLYYYSYERGWRPLTTTRPLRIGSAGHAGLDVLAKTGDIDQAISAVDTAYAECEIPASDEAVRQLEIDAETVRQLVRGYVAAWGASRVEIIESETCFDEPIINPDTGRTSRTFRQAGKRDRACRLPTGQLALMETKFVSAKIDPDPILGETDYWRILALNQQITKYVYAARLAGLEIETTIYDVVRRPTIKPTDVPILDQDGLKIVLEADGSRAMTKQGKPRQTAGEGQTLRTMPMTIEEWGQKLAADIAGRPAYYYQRREIPRLDSDIDEYVRELWQIAKSIGGCRLSERWYRNSGSCRRYNSICPYYPLCAGEIEWREITGPPAGYRQAECVHEELTPLGRDNDETGD